MKEFIKNNFRPFLTALGITAFVIICMYHTSCHITPEGITLITNDCKSAKIEGFKIDGSDIHVEFSKNVKVEQCFVVEASDDLEKVSSIENFHNCENKMQVEWEDDPDEFIIHYKLKEKTKIGKCYELYSVVRDSAGSSLSFALPFFGENDHFPDIVISEINEAYSNKEALSEYIELYALSSGNLFGLELISASNDRHYPLPDIEINKGEYIVVHLRGDENDKNCVTEKGSNLNLSKARGSVAARDIWINSSESALNSTAEIVLLNNNAKNKLLDCVMYCKKDYALSNKDWKTESLCKYAALCSDAGLWNKPCIPENAVYSNERKSISYISRTNIEGLKNSPERNNDAKCWTGTAKSKMTPGKKNAW